MTTKIADSFVQDLEASFIGRNDAVDQWGNAIPAIQSLPGLRGFWPLSAISSAGNAFDQSGNGRTLTYNGNPTYNVDRFLIPYLDLDGTGDFLSRADEAGLDIAGNESFLTHPGFSMGGWFWLDTIAATATLMGKWGAAGQRSYRLVYTTGVGVSFEVSADGTAVTTGGTSDNISASTWRFLVTSQRQGASFLDIYWNDATGLNRRDAGLLPVIFNSTAPFRIGANGSGTELLDGRASLCWLGNSKLNIETVTGLFEQQRGLFGV